MYKSLIVILIVLFLFIAPATANLNDCELVQINSTHWYFKSAQTGLSDGIYSYQAYANNISSDYRVVTVTTSPTSITSLTNTTGNFWVNHTWDSGANTDTFNISASTNDIFIIRPDGDGVFKQLTPGSPTNWQMVDDVTPDTGTVVFRGGTGCGRDTYRLPNHTTESGEIESVRVYNRVDHWSPGGSYIKEIVYTYSTLYYGDTNPVPYSWTTFDYVWYNNPYTVSDWTWNEIDLLEVGGELCAGVPYNPQITQVYAEIEWENGSSSWTNGSANTYFNDSSLSPHEWSNITVYGYNASSGVLSSGVSQNVQIPNNVPVISNVSASYTINEGETLNIYAEYSDADSDSVTFADNATEWNINSGTGIASWTPADGDNGTYHWYINVSDGYGGVDTQVFSVTVNDSIYPPTVVLISQTPSEICQNCTGNISILYGVAHDSSGLNNTSVSFIYRDYDHDLSDSNHSIRPPCNDMASEWNFDGRILRGANRNETPGLNFETNASITGGDPYTWSGLDENCTEVNIVPVNDTYTRIYINSTIHRVMPQMHYIDRSEMQEAPKTQIEIHKSQNVLVKFWNFEIFKGNTDFLGAGYTGTYLNPNPTFHPSDANPVNYYYVSSGYDPTTGSDPLTSGYAVYMGSLNASEWIDYVHTPHANASYVRGFIDNNLLELYVNTTNISYLYFTSNTPSSKPFYINVTDVATSSNVSFADTKTLWAGDTVLSQQSFTLDIWFAFMKDNMSFDHKIYIADNNDKWANSTLSSTVIGAGLFPPTDPAFYAFHNGFQDFNMNGTYNGIIQVQVSASSDPDGGPLVPHNLTIHYGNGTLIGTINGSATAEDGVYTNITFDTTPYSTLENYTLRVVATDDEGETATIWLGVNFTINYDNFTFSNSGITPSAIREGEPFTVSVDINDTDGNVATAIVKINYHNYTMTNTGGDTWSYTFTGTQIPTRYEVEYFYAQDDFGEWNSTLSTLYIDAVSSTGKGSTGGISLTPTPTPTPEPTREPPIEKIPINITEKFENIVDMFHMYTDGNYISIFHINFDKEEKIYSKQIYIDNPTYCNILNESTLINECALGNGVVTVSMPFVPEDEGLFLSTRDYVEISGNNEVYYVNVDVFIVNLYGLATLENGMLMLIILLAIIYFKKKSKKVA